MHFFFSAPMTSERVLQKADKAMAAGNVRGALVLLLRYAENGNTAIDRRISACYRLLAEENQQNYDADGFAERYAQLCPQAPEELPLPEEMQALIQLADSGNAEAQLRLLARNTSELPGEKAVFYLLTLPYREAFLETEENRKRVETATEQYSHLLSAPDQLWAALPLIQKAVFLNALVKNQLIHFCVQKSAEGGVAEAALQYAVLCRLEDQPDDAETYCRLAAASGHPEAREMLDEILADRRQAENEQRRRALLDEAEGLDRFEDHSRRFALLQEAADLGEPAAMREFGLLYLDALDVPLDFQTAESWLRKAAAARDRKAMTYVDWLSQDAAIVYRNLPCRSHSTRAFYIACYLAALGESTGFGRLGLFFAEQDYLVEGLCTLKQDVNVAFWFLSRAMEAGGDDQSRAAYASFLYLGLGTQQDREKARSILKNETGDHCLKAQEILPLFDLAPADQYQEHLRLLNRAVEAMEQVRTLSRQAMEAMLADNDELYSARMDEMDEQERLRDDLALQAGWMLRLSSLQGDGDAGKRVRKIQSYVERIPSLSEEEKENISCLSLFFTSSQRYRIENL